MKTQHHIHLHPEVKQLLEGYISNNKKYSNLSPEEFALYIIENKSKIYQPILASLVGDSFAVEFSGNTNNGKNSGSHKKFQNKIKGFVISNVAPNFGRKEFQDIFLSSNIENKLWKDFYGSGEEIDLGFGKTLNATAYKKHFKIWAEINVAAARIHGATKIVLPGMGLGIYAGGISDQGKTQLAELQFKILKEISQKNQDIEFEFFGVSSGSKNICKKENLTGIAFDAQQDMVKEADAGKVMRVVAGSNNIILGGGSGDNCQIGKDTNVSTLVQSKNKEYIVNCNGVLTEFTGIPVINALPAEVRNQLKENIKEYIELLRKVGYEKPLKEPSNLSDYSTIRKLWREVSERDFSRFSGNEEFTKLIEQEEKLLKNLQDVNQQLSPGIIEWVLELVRDCWSYISQKLGFNSERRYCTEVAEKGVMAF